MNHQVNVIIAGADMGGLISSCALHKTVIVDVPNNYIDFHISHLEKEVLMMEDVEECDLSGIQYAVNATLHDTEASFAFDEKCKEMGIPVVHAVNLGKVAFLAVEKPKGYPFSEIMKRNLNETSRSDKHQNTAECWNASIFCKNLGEYISRYGKFWQMPVLWIDEIIEKVKAMNRAGNTDGADSLFAQESVGAWIAAGYCVNILQNLVEGKEVKYFPKFYLSPLLEEI